jgi:hypothetical protein
MMQNFIEFIGDKGNYDLLQMVKIKKILKRKATEPEVNINKFIKNTLKNNETYETKLL